MNNGVTLGIIDSGAGGLTTLAELVKLNCASQYLYLGDTENLPYGNKSKDQLLSLTLKNIKLLLDSGVDAVVLGCNTLSVTLYSELKKYCPCQIFGVFPPVKLALRITKNPLLLATVGTVNQLKPLKINAQALRGLASDIETNLYSLNKIDLSSHLKKQKCDMVILGCTHYGFLKNDIESYFGVKSISGNYLTALAVKDGVKNCKIAKIPKITFIKGGGQNYLKIFTKIQNLPFESQFF